LLWRFNWSNILLSISIYSKEAKNILKNNGK
jgi:hypothetical protein